MLIILVVQPYKKQFKAYSVIDAFMLLFLGVVCIMNVAGDEASIYFHKGTHLVLV